MVVTEVFVYIKMYHVMESNISV